jgi:hypothetical protein
MGALLREDGARRAVMRFDRSCACARGFSNSSLF